MEGVPLASDFTVKTYWEVCEEQPRLVNIHVWLWVDWIKVPFGLKGTLCFFASWQLARSTQLRRSHPSLHRHH
jgi:hypothetical protein